MNADTDKAHSPVTSLDLLMELQGEQQAFRFLVRALSALLATAAVIAVGSVVYFYFELQGLRAEYARQALLNQVNLRIVAGEASRQRESTQAQLVAIREENEGARRQAELSRELQQAGSPSQIAAYKDRAVAIARGHILGKTMNEVTSQVVAMVLRTDESGNVRLLTDGERILMQAALDDWGGQVGLPVCAANSRPCWTRAAPCRTRPSARPASPCWNTARRTPIRSAGTAAVPRWWTM